jgi:RNA polymerase sigma factor (sigma-70 family)
MSRQMAQADLDHESFRRLFDTAYQPLLAYALRRTRRREDAEEIVADTLLVAWRRRQHMPGGADAIPWLYGVARRLVANQRRGQGRRRRLERVLEPLTRPTVDPGELAEAADMTRAVVAASRRLREDDQEILRLAAWEGLSHRQIAVSLGCSENAAALRLHRARQRLREEVLKGDRFPGQDLVEVIR